MLEHLRHLKQDGATPGPRCLGALQNTNEGTAKYAVSHYHQACRGMSGRYNIGAKDKYFYVNLAELIIKRCPSQYKTWENT